MAAILNHQEMSVDSDNPGSPAVKDTSGAPGGPGESRPPFAKPHPGEDAKLPAEKKMGSVNEEVLVYGPDSAFQKIFSDPQLRERLIEAGYKFGVQTYEDASSSGEVGKPMIKGNMKSIVDENSGKLILAFYSGKSKSKPLEPNKDSSAKNSEAEKPILSVELRL